MVYCQVLLISPGALRVVTVEDDVELVASADILTKCCQWLVHTALQ